MVENIFPICFHILGVLIPADFHMFQRGKSTTNQYIIIIKPYIYIFKLTININSILPTNGRSTTNKCPESSIPLIPEVVSELSHQW